MSLSKLCIDVCLWTSRLPLFYYSDSVSLGFFDISDELFPPQFCLKFDIIKSIWVNSILADEACELSLM